MVRNAFRITSATASTILALLAPLSVHAGNMSHNEQGYFYRGLPYGSDAAFHPISELINGTFGVLQISSNWVTLDEINWRRGFGTTWESISHPVRTVDTYGSKKFFTSEVVPGKLAWSNLQYVPNYFLHMIGGGARHRAFMEWYDAYGFSHPRLLAWGTTALHAFAVEAVEHHQARGPTVDPVADMLIFDPLGALLFSSDCIADFFAGTLNMSIWSGQPMYNPVLNTFENTGENYGLHFFFRKNHRVGLFSYWGMSHLFGITVRDIQSCDWSVGLGGAVDELQEDVHGTGMSSFSARLSWDVGVFLHRNKSLLASLHVSQAWTQLFRFNLYPGWLRVGGLSTGTYVGVRGNDVILGMSFGVMPVGVGVSR